MNCNSDGSEYVVGCDESECSRANGVVERLQQESGPAEIEMARKCSQVFVGVFKQGGYDWPEAEAVDAAIRNGASEQAV